MRRVGILAITAVLAWPSVCLSQSTFFARVDSPACGWFTVGGTIAGIEDGAGYISASHLSPIGLLSARFVMNKRNYFDPASPREGRLEQMGEVSGLYGIACRPWMFLLSASTGLGTVWATERASSL